ncbi:unnamed protein product [Calypogeia fissa]
MASLGSVQAKRESLCKLRIVDLEFKISRLGLLGKAYYELAQIKLRRHRNLIKQARTQNRLTHAALDTLREKERIARRNATDLGNLRKVVVALRVTFNHQRALMIKRHFQLEAQVTQTHASEQNCAHALDPNTPPLQKIRLLEAQLCMIRLKTKDVQTLLRHYTQSLKPMKEEYFTYGAKLESAQETLTMKNDECEKLIQTHHDAIRARDAAKVELEELLASLFPKGLRSTISKELQNKILAAIKQIKEVMGVGSMREMYHQFIMQEKQTAYLEQIYDELQRTVYQLRQKKRRRTTMRPNELAALHEVNKSVVRRHSSRRGSIQLIQILEGTKKLVDKLHDGNIVETEAESVERQVLTQVEERLTKILKALNRKLKHVQKEAEKKRAADEKLAASQA